MGNCMFPWGLGPGEQGVQQEAQTLNSKTGFFICSECQYNSFSSGTKKQAGRLSIQVLSSNHLEIIQVQKDTNISFI